MRLSVLSKLCNVLNIFACGSIKTSTIYALLGHLDTALYTNSVVFAALLQA
jgi:hypothetical protein